MADDLESEGGQAAEHVPECPAHGVVPAEGFGLHHLEDTDYRDRREQRGTDAGVNPRSILPLPKRRLLLGKREEGPNRRRGGSLPSARGRMG